MKRKIALLLGISLSVTNIQTGVFAKSGETTGAIIDENVSGAAIKVLAETAVLPYDDATYSVPVRMVQAANPKVTSMGNDALDGNAIVTVKGGKAEITLNFKAVVKTGLYGHLLKLWSYPEADEMNYDWWNTDAETPAEVTETFMDYGMEYPSGNTTKSEFVKKFRIIRENAGEKHIYIRVSVDAMAGFDQPARLDLDWDNASVVEYAQDTTETTTEATTEITTIVMENNTEITSEADTETTTDITETSTETTTNTSTETTTAKSTSGGGSGSSSSDIQTENFEDGKYWMTFHLWNAHLDQASMGDAAFENNRQALVTISDGGKKAKIQIASNPVAVSGYTSALQDITSDEVSISIDKKESFTTNTRYDGTQHTFQRVSVFSFELDDTSTEYVSVRINTPYTPMDNISENEGGFIAARLKLEWGSMNDAGENAKISSDNSVASGSSSSDNSGSSVNKIDDETGIQIKADEYVFPADTEFKTERIESGDDYETAKKLIDTDEFRLFTIKAENNEKEVSPDGVADVCFPVGDTDENVKIYRINKETNTQEAGAVELEYKLSSDKRYYVITVKEFGLFAVAKTDEEMNVEVGTDDMKAEDKPVLAEEKVSFADIEDHPAREYIIRAVEKGLFNGVSESEFAPDKEATRAMFVTVLGRLEGIDEDTNKTSTFDDVNDDDYFNAYVIWASENGIVSGVSDTKFAPYDILTREQMCTILYNYAKYKGISLTRVYRMSFDDMPEIHDWAKDAVIEVSDSGIIGIDKIGYFEPKNTVGRADIAEVIVNFSEEYLKSESDEITEESLDETEDEISEKDEENKTDTSEKEN